MYEYREGILDIVNASQGIGVTDIAIRLMDTINPVKFDHEKFNKSIIELILNEEIFGIRFAIPNIGVKSLFFPIGTRVIGK